MNNNIEKAIKLIEEQKQAASDQYDQCAELLQRVNKGYREEKISLLISQLSIMASEGKLGIGGILTMHKLVTEYAVMDSHMVLAED